MTATTILANLRDRGLSLRVEEGQLRVRPKALLTPADREGIGAEDGLIGPAEGAPLSHS